MYHRPISQNPQIHSPPKPTYWPTLAGYLPHSGLHHIVAGTAGVKPDLYTSSLEFKFEEATNL